MKICCDTAYVKITVKPDCNVPDVLTPNGDGMNDVLYIDCIDKYPRNEVYVYNRWGTEVFSDIDYQNDWGGTYNGSLLPDGTYYFIVINRDTGEDLIHGYITIHR